jgi:hypothetical protein
LNGDSDPDLAVADFISNDVAALLGGSGGGFGPAALFPGRERPLAGRDRRLRRWVQTP